MLDSHFEVDFINIALTQNREKFHQKIGGIYTLKLVTVMLVTVCDAGDIFWMLMVDFGDQNGQNRQQHLKVITNTFRLQHISSSTHFVFNIGHQHRCNRWKSKLGDKFADFGRSSESGVRLEKCSFWSTSFDPFVIVRLRAFVSSDNFGGTSFALKF